MSFLNQKPFQFWLFIGLLALGFLWIFQSILAPFIVGIAIAYLLNPIVSALSSKGLPRWLSASIILLLFFMVMIIGLLFAIPVLVREMVDFIQLLPSIARTSLDFLQENLARFGIILPESINDFEPSDIAFIKDNGGDALNAGKSILGGVLKGGMAVLGVISFLVLMPIVAFYMMIDWPNLTRKIQDIMPQKKKTRIQSILSDIDRSLAGFIRGQLTVCLFLGGFYAIGLSLMGLQYGFFVGVAAGVLSIIPYVGSMFGLVASVGLAFYQFDGWEYPAVALAIFIAGQLIEGNYLTPKLVGESVGLHPLWVIFVLMAGGALMGIVGMMIAVPVAAIIAVFIRHAISVYKDSSYYKGKAK